MQATQFVSITKNKTTETMNALFELKSIVNDQLDALQQADPAYLDGAFVSGDGKTPGTYQGLTREQFQSALESAKKLTAIATQDLAALMLLFG